MVNVDRGLAYAAHCGRYECPDCFEVKCEAAAAVINRGCREAWTAQQRVRFMTLTASPERGPRTTAELYACWTRLRERIAYRVGWRQPYWGTVEHTRDGALHLHVLLVGHASDFLPAARDRYYAGRTVRGTTVPPCLGRDGNLVKVSWLGTQAWESGFGYVVDIQQVRDDGDVVTGVAKYLSKSFSEVTDSEVARFALDHIDPNAAYVSGLSKHLASTAMAQRFRASGAERVRPYRSSRSWPGGSLSAEEAAIRAERAGIRRAKHNDPSADTGWACWLERDLGLRSDPAS
jgi:hypothetical protein